MEKEFNLKTETEKWADKWIHKKLTGRAYKELRNIEKEFIKLLKKDFYHAIMQCELGKTLYEQDKKIREIINKQGGDKFA